MESVIEGTAKRWGGGRDGKKSFYILDVVRVSDGQIDTITVWSNQGLPDGIKVGSKHKLLCNTRETTVNEIKRL